ncbi:MAG: hypothetical protein JNL08_03950 [Planctomycetes bacterium]|nr:hypothetical protein [Planctomycetota bacterium]
MSAQTPVTVRCTPTDGSAAGCYYCPGFEHVIKWVGTQMHCSTINLLTYHNQDVVITGTWNGSVIEVTSVAPTIESFSISGNGTIGGRFDFNVVADEGSLALNFLSLDNAFFVPFGGLAVQIDPASAFVLSGGVVDSGGEYGSRLDIPDDASLIGLRVYGQGLVVDPAGQWYTTNVDTKVID